MSTSRKIQLALVASLLWSSTSVSSFAATNTITPEKNQSDTVKLPVESIPSRQLNLTPDTYLIAIDGDQIYSLARQIDTGYNYIPKFEDALTKPDSKEILLAFCPSQPQDKVDNCWKILKVWSNAKEMQLLDSKSHDGASINKIIDISDAVFNAILQRKSK